MNNINMSGPWYEVSGPSVEEVRVDILEHFSELSCEKKHYKDEEIKEYLEQSLMKVVPDDMKDLGSYRGYACFTKPKLLKKLKHILFQNYGLKFTEKSMVNA